METSITSSEHLNRDSKNHDFPRLTQTVTKGGCAAKVAASELREILARVSFPPSGADLLVGTASFDDAAVIGVSEELALVQTLDFFTPIVDSPRCFGQIAAANALSDVYAMGGIPKTAMGILAFPTASFSQELIAEVLNGACDKLREAKVALVGGHSIDDETLKFGLSVTGYVSPKRVWTNAGAQPGDVLILTKALGTGTACAALKRSLVTEHEIRSAIMSMQQLNSVAECFFDGEKDLRGNIHAATDVTGFGLAGHATNIARASQVCLQIAVESLPILERTEEFLRAGILTRAHGSNLQYVRASTKYPSGLQDWQRLATLDPQTSGGLLLAVDRDHADSVLTALQSRFLSARRIGCVQALSGDDLVQFI